MFSNYLSSIDGVSMYAIVGLILFVSLFVGVSVWALKADKSYLNKMRNLPLESDSENKIENSYDQL